MTEPRHRVVVAGAGVAGLETVLALRELAVDRVRIQVVSPERELSYRPLEVAEPFGSPDATHFDLVELFRSLRVSLLLDSLVEVDPAQRIARTAAGEELAYDSLVVACGACAQEGVPGALTFHGHADRDAIAALLADLAAGRFARIAFAVPHGPVWQLPLYELALMTAARVSRLEGVRIVLATPEPEPLAMFGHPASEAVRGLLDARGVEVITGVYPLRVEPGELVVTGGDRVPADRVVTLPWLEGPRLPGLPRDQDGFVPTDLHGSVPGLVGVYAAGDATTFPVKQGGLAAQQADAVAEVIAAHAGAPVTPEPFRPVLRGLLLTGEDPEFLRSELTGGGGETSTADREPLWWPPSKIVGRHLSPFLAARAGVSLSPPAARGAVEVEVELDH